MLSAALDIKVDKFKNMVGSTKRIGVSELARSKSWRDTLPERGCFEVVDRSGVVGYMLAPDYAEALSEKLTELEEQIEKNQIAAMFKARKDRTNIKTGSELKHDALTYFDNASGRLAKIINGD